LGAERLVGIQILHHPRCRPGKTTIAANGGHAVKHLDAGRSHAFGANKKGRTGVVAMAFTSHHDFVAAFFKGVEVQYQVAPVGVHAAAHAQAVGIVGVDSNAVGDRELLGHKGPGLSAPVFALLPGKRRLYERRVIGLCVGLERTKQRLGAHEIERNGVGLSPSYAFGTWGRTRHVGGATLGEGMLQLRLGAGWVWRRELPGNASAPVASVTLAYGYRAPFSLRQFGEEYVDVQTRRPGSRYMLGVRLWLNAQVDVAHIQAWQLTGGLEFEPVGALRFLTGIGY
jgi:hypothetical protein